MGRVCLVTLSNQKANRGDTAEDSHDIPHSDYLLDIENKLFNSKTHYMCVYSTHHTPNQMLDYGKFCAFVWWEKRTKMIRKNGKRSL